MNQDIGVKNFDGLHFQTTFICLFLTNKKSKMIGPWAQFLRNFFCVIKALFTSSNFFFNKKVFPQNYVNKYISSKTTWIELFTAPFQLIAVLLNIYGGYQSLFSGISNYYKNAKYLRLLDRYTLMNDTTASATILRHKILREIHLAKHAFLVGIMSFIISIGFVFLTMNSLHIISPSPVYAGLVGQEICLVYFLFEMINSCFKSLSAQDDYQFLSLLLLNLNDGDMTQAQFLSLLYDFGYNDNRMYFALTLLDPSSFLSVDVDKSLHNNDISMELNKIDSFLEKIMSNADHSKINRQNHITNLHITGQKLSNEFYLNLLYFILNFIAGYGYMMGIFTFCFPHTAATVPFWLQIIYFGLTPSQADWWGNFAGDLSWTIEPFIVLLLAYYSQYHAWSTSVSVHSTTTATATTTVSEKKKSVPQSKATPSKDISTDAGLRKSARKKKVQ